MKKFLDTDHPFFKPLWIRVVIVVLTAGWGILEFVTGSPFWAVLFLSICAYCIWGFFFNFDPDHKLPDPSAPDQPGPDA